MSAQMIDIILNNDDGFTTAYQRKCARAELAQLRADLQAAQERSMEQARLLGEAREIIGIAKNDYQEDVQDGIDSYDKGQRCIEWLAANPAPQVEQP